MDGLSKAQRQHDRQLPAEHDVLSDRAEADLIADEVARMLSTPEYDPLATQNFVEAVMESPIVEVAFCLGLGDAGKHAEADIAFRALSLRYWTKFCTKIAESRIQSF